VNEVEMITTPLGLDTCSPLNMILSKSDRLRLTV
jgi:hypothetical protein